MDIGEDVDMMDMPVETPSERAQVDNDFFNGMLGWLIDGWIGLLGYSSSPLSQPPIASSRPHFECSFGFKSDFDDDFDDQDLSWVLQSLRTLHPVVRVRVSRGYGQLQQVMMASRIESINSILVVAGIDRCKGAFSPNRSSWTRRDAYIFIHILEYSDP